MFEIKVSMCERERLNERGCPVRERVWEFACAWVRVWAMRELMRVLFFFT